MSHKENLKKLSVEIFKTWEDMMGQALNSGALSDEMKDSENSLLVKAVIYAWSKKNNFNPLSNKTKKEYDNLSYFI